MVSSVSSIIVTMLVACCAYYVYGKVTAIASVQGIDNMFGGNMDKSWCNSRKCFNNCVAWQNIDNNANQYCTADVGDGWIYSGEKGQADCTAGFGKGVCKQDPSRDGVKYTNNCAAWNSLEGRNDWCANDLGSGWEYHSREQAGCSVGFGKVLCKKVTIPIGTRKENKNCTLWTDIPNDGYCRNDYGGGWKAVGRVGGGCAWGQGKGVCEYTG